MKIEEINNNTCFFNYGNEKIYLDRVIDDDRINNFSNHITLSDESGNSLFVSLNHKNSEVRKLIYSPLYHNHSSSPYSSYHNYSSSSLSSYNKNDHSISFLDNLYPFYKESLFDFNNEINDIFLNIKGNVSILFENFIFKDKKHFFEIIKNIFQNNKIISNSIFFINDEKSKISNSSIENLTTKGLIQIYLSNIKNDNNNIELQDSIINNALNIKNIQGSNINIENTDEFKNSKINNIQGSNVNIKNSEIQNLTSKSKEGEKTIISNSKIENLTTEGELEISLSNIKNLTSKSKEGEKTIISNSKIENLTTEGELEISLSNIKNLTSKSKEGEKTIISNSKIENLTIKAWVEIIESTIKATIKSKIEISGNIEPLEPTQKTFFEKTFLTIEKEELLIEESIFQKVDNFFIGNNNSSINNCISEIKRSTLQNLKNYLKIDGTIEIIGSVIGNKDNFYKGGLIFFNNKNEHIKISDSELKEDVSIFQNAVINNAILSGNCSVFQNSEISGDKKHIHISGYTKLFGRSQIRGIETNISGFINIYGESNISGNPTIYGNVNILDDARVSGKAELKKEEIINKFNERYS